jgi:HD-GYP domain-containing protein (c-di-GMP phosphodiesterase class II)
MKPFKFKTKATVLKGVKEEPPKKRTNWDRIIYLILFAVIFISIVYYAISKSFYINVSGHVYSDQFTVNFAEDVSVFQYFVDESDSIEIGDTLFYYRLNMDEDDGGGAAAAAVITDRSDWYLKERLQTQKKISLTYIAIEDFQNNIKRINAELEKTKKEVYLDVYPQVELKKALLEIETYKVDIKKAEDEIAYLKKYLSLLNYYEQQEILNQPIINAGGADEVILWDYYRSPVDGIVAKIFNDPKEVSYKKDPVMFLNDFNKTFIFGYIDQADISHFETGETVSVNFADGSMSKGIIDYFYLNTEELPLDFVEPKARYKRRVVVKIVPESEEVADEWKKQHLYEVRITKTRYF